MDDELVESFDQLSHFVYILVQNQRLERQIWSLRRSRELLTDLQRKIQLYMEREMASTLFQFLPEDLVSHIHSFL